MDDHEPFEDKFAACVDAIDPTDLASDDETKKIKNLKMLSECRPPQPETDIVPEPAPATFWGKVKLAAKTGWEAENTGVLIKSGLAFASTAAVIYVTVHRDHVLTKEALQQANQQAR